MYLLSEKIDRFGVEWCIVVEWTGSIINECRYFYDIRLNLWRAKEMMIKRNNYELILIRLLLTIIAALLLCISILSFPEILPGEMAGQWYWLSKVSVLFMVIIFPILLFSSKSIKIGDELDTIIVWTLILLAGIESVWGMWQIYGLLSSNHSLFSLTGTFFNPGPYSGYLAMIFPVCLNEWLALKDKAVNLNNIEKVMHYLSGGILLLIICILPAGMSRSAWLAAIISGLWIYGIHYSWKVQIQTVWQMYRKKVIAIIVLLFICLIVGGIAAFNLKKNSADGRLFMWKIASKAIVDKPLTGYGTYGFPSAFGKTQENYFAQGDYSPQEELVAGSPVYAFNEYLQVAIEWGIPVTFCILSFILFCFYRGKKSGRISLCGGLVALLVFSFSSYPMQLPAFIISLVLFLSVCLIGNSRVGWGIFALIVGVVGFWGWKENIYESCKRWADCSLLYRVGAYSAVKKDYMELYPVLRNRATFLFEYGHCLHKLNEYEASNEILQEASDYSCDPMIFNIMGKNNQLLKRYELAEEYYLRSSYRLPGRIYPYYLLAKLYAEQGYYQPEKLKMMANTVLTKEPKVYSKAIEEMRSEMKVLLDTLNY